MGAESKGVNDLEAECRRKEKMPKVKGWVQPVRAEKLSRLMHWIRKGFVKEGTLQLDHTENWWAYLLFCLNLFSSLSECLSLSQTKTCSLPLHLHSLCLRLTWKTSWGLVTLGGGWVTAQGRAWQLSTWGPSLLVTCQVPSRCGPGTSLQGSVARIFGGTPVKWTDSREAEPPGHWHMLWAGRWWGGDHA